MGEHAEHHVGPPTDDLAKRYEHLCQMMDLCPDVFYSISESGVFLFANRAAAAFFGSEPAGLVGRRFQDVYAGPDGDALLEEIAAVLRSGQPVETSLTHLVRHDGERRAFRFRDIPFVDRASGGRAVIGVGIDITDEIAHAEERAVHERVQRDLEIARSIQRALLPGGSLRAPPFEIAGWSEPAEQTGGDHYDWMPLPDGRIVVSLADVSGHGIGPAIVTAVCRAYARAILSDPRPLQQHLARVNDLLHQDLPTDRFVTFVAALIDPPARTVEVLSAGHGPTFLRRSDASVERLGAQGIPLGIMPDHEYEPGVVLPMGPGDALVLISDGFFEWACPDGEQFGLDRLEAIIRAGGPSASGLIEAMRSAVSGFAAGAPQPDDMTAIVIQS